MDTKMAAIALTLIVAIPIMLGYALALEEEEITGWETTESVNITDMMTNSTNNIYVTSTAPANNSEIYARIYYPGSGVTETSTLSPNYVSVGNVYSSIPTYTTSTGTLSVGSAQTTTSEGTDYGSYTEFTVTEWGLYPWVYITTDQLSQMYYGNTSYIGTSFGPFVEIGAAYYGKLGGNVVTVDTIRIVSDRSPTYTMTYREYMDVPDALGEYYSFSVTQWTAMRVFHSNGTWDVITPADGTNTIVRSGSLVIVNGTSYYDVNLVQIAPAASQIAISYTKLTASGNYADPSYGWNLDLSPGNAVYPYWMNGSVNGSVRMMIAIADGEFLDLQCVDANGNTTSTVSIRDTSGVVTVGGETLGNYSYLCADISGSSVTVSGISAWPNMYVAPQLINSITVDMANTVEDFVRVYLSASSTMEFRVDSAEVLSGTFGTIEDYTLNMTSLWPSDSYSVALTSAGIYGTSITFAGQTYAVSDGKITVNGSSIPVRNVVFSSIYDEEELTWSNQINGVELSTSATPSTIVFGGEWSMTAAAYKMQEVTSTELVWNAGEFAFNGVDDKFALMGLLTCVAVFIGLGMYGRRSGAKVGTLMIICGCAAFVFLAMM